MDSDALKLDLEYITQARLLPVSDSLGQVIARLDLVGKIPDLDHRLQHYLTKRNYVKALEWLADPTTPHH